MSNIKDDKFWDPIDFTVYFSFVKWPLLAAVAAEIIFRFWATRAGWLEADVYAWFIRLAVFAFIGWRTIKSFGSSTPVALMAGAVAGAALGIVIALFRFSDGIKIWKFFNLFNETVMAALVGALVSLFVIYIFSLKK